MEKSEYTFGAGASLQVEAAAPRHIFASVFDSAQTRARQHLTIHCSNPAQLGMRMTDKYVYHFTGPFGPGGEIAVSPQAATLEAIQGRGEPVMESQIEVDQTELDCDGFLVRFGISTNPIDSLWSQIRSLKLRAESRDAEALQFNERTDGERKYMLQLEGKELRRQAERLEAQRIELLRAKFHGHDKMEDVLLADIMTAE
jgi:hypothetical protein